MEFKDYHQVLGVARDATDEQIKKAFRKLARKHHPDVSKVPDAAARMSEVNEAHPVLADPERRAACDAAGRSQRGGQAFRPACARGSRSGWPGSAGRGMAARRRAISTSTCRSCCRRPAAHGPASCMRRWLATSPSTR